MEETVRRELQEETGFRAGKITRLTEIHPCIGYSDERMWLYLAEHLESVEVKRDEDEFIEVIPTPLQLAIEMVWDGRITDVKTIIGILWAERLLASD